MVGGLDKLGVLFFEQLEVALGLPVPDGIRGKEEIHLLERALIRLGVESPDHGDGEGVASSEDIKSTLADVFEHDRAEEGLRKQL